MPRYLVDISRRSLAKSLFGRDYALPFGVATFDASAGGLGGCPYAPGAAGNLATDDLVYMLNGMGVDTGVSLPRLSEASAFIATCLDHPLVSRYAQANVKAVKTRLKS